MNTHESQPITVGNPRNVPLLAYHRHAMTACIDAMWDDPVMSPHRKEIEPIFAQLAIDDDIDSAIEDACEYFLDGVFDDEHQAAQWKTAMEHCEGWIREYSELWLKLNRAELKEMERILSKLDKEKTKP
jgi:hypothetical protein